MTVLAPAEVGGIPAAAPEGRGWHALGAPLEYPPSLKSTGWPSSPIHLMLNLRQILSAALLATAGAAAQADYVTSSQGVDFTFHTVDADSFTLRIENADNATGNWSTANYLSFLGFDGLVGTGGRITGAHVSVTPAGTPVSQWSFTAAQLTGQGCGNGGNSGAICLDANPNIRLSSDLLFSIDLIGAGINLNGNIAPHLKVGFTTATGNRPIGSLLSATMTPETTPNIRPNDGPLPLPEPASLALAALALAGAAAARRQARR